MGASDASARRQLWILRHAKAAGGPPGGRDRDRPLAARGRRDASALAARLAAPGPVLGTPGLSLPDRVLCSSAARTTQTAELVVARLADPVPVDRYHSLYQADPDTVLDVVREMDDDARSVLVVGHNPTMFHVTWDVLGGAAADRDRLDSTGFPTCTLAVVDLGTGSWADVSGGQGLLVGLFTPPY